MPCTALVRALWHATPRQRACLKSSEQISLYAVLALAAIAGLCCWRRRRRQGGGKGALRRGGKQVIQPIPLSGGGAASSSAIPAAAANGTRSGPHSDLSSVREGIYPRTLSPVDFVESRPDSDDRSTLGLRASRSSFLTDTITNVLNPLAQRHINDVAGDSIGSSEGAMSQQLDTMMSSMKIKIQTAVANMQAELQEELQEDDLKIHHVLGQGAFGTVYHGARQAWWSCCLCVDQMRMRCACMNCEKLCPSELRCLDRRNTKTVFMQASGKAFQWRSRP